MNATGTPRIAVIIAAAGSGERLGGDIPKPWRTLGGQSLLERAWQSFAPESLQRNDQKSLVDQVVLAVDAARVKDAQMSVKPSSIPTSVVVGGATRTASVRNALREVSDTLDIVAVHDAARPFWPRDKWDSLVDTAVRVGGAVPGIPVSDTIKRVESYITETVNRDRLWAVQTPQVFRAALIREAYERAARDGANATDDAELVRRVGGKVEVVPSTSRNFKITTASDWKLAELMVEGGYPIPQLRVGSGFDAHRLGGSNPLMLGGVKLSDSGGLIGHSDGDALLHALCDALLGAAALRDIGHHFPPDDPRFKGCDSRMLVRETIRILKDAGFAPVQADATVMAERPRLSTYIPDMCAAVASDLGLDIDLVSIKATTTEGRGFVGRGEGIAVQVVATIRPLTTDEPR
jgi:2-C-methyl-D-erythritol 4-phosphate cytidylyltransferase/2-C-methyl-D-erythritol 2,4-cyclodiphosphate synthase